jgi:hypothetical protein
MQTLLLGAGPISLKRYCATYPHPSPAKASKLPAAVRRLLGASVTLDPAWLGRSSAIYSFLSPTEVLKFTPGVARPARRRANSAEALLRD